MQRNYVVKENTSENNKMQRLLFRHIGNHIKMLASLENKKERNLTGYLKTLSLLGKVRMGRTAFIEKNSYD
jgi:hypothetical protein